MNNMNSINLIGRLTKDLEIKKTQNGNSFVNFTIAINRTYTSASGEREADFINCVAWNKTAENMFTYLGKGSLIGIEGKLQTRNYEDNNGKRIYVTEILVSNVEFLENKQSNNNQNDFVQNNAVSNDFMSSLDTTNDDDLPF